MGKGGGSGSTQTVVQNSAPPQFLQDAYTSLLNRATNVANTPLTQYGAPTVAGFTPDQTSAFNSINNAQGAANPYITQAAQSIGNSTGNIWSQIPQYSASAISNFQNPYTQQVVNATTAQLQNMDAQQQQQLTGNAISQGAWGGDRAGVAKAALAGQQDIANNQTIAGLYSQGFSQAQQEFNQQQQAKIGTTEANDWLNSQAGFAYGNLGNEALNTQLSGASAQLQSGALQQQLGQELLNVPYQNFLQQQAYPFQTTGYLQGITEGINAGGTSSTTSPGPSTLSQVGGLGLAGLGALGSSGLLGSFGSAAAGPTLSGAAGYTTGGSGILGFLGGLFNQGGRVSRATGGGTGLAKFQNYQPPHAPWFVRDQARGMTRQQHFDGGGGVAENTYHTHIPEKTPDVPDMDQDYITGESNKNGVGHGGIGIPPPPKEAVNPSQPSMKDQLSNGEGIGKLLSGLLGKSGSSAPFFNSDASLSGMSDLFGGSSVASEMGSSEGLSLIDSPSLAGFFNKGGRTGYKIGGQVLPDVLSGIGDIVGAFFGDPGAGDQGVGLLSALDGGRTGGQGIEGQMMSNFMNRGGIARGCYDDGGIIGGATPAQTANPNVDSFYQKLDALPLEKLQEAAARTPPGSQQGNMIRQILQKKQVMPQQQPQQAQPAAGLPTQQQPMMAAGGRSHLATDGTYDDDIETVDVPPIDRADLAVPNVTRGTMDDADGIYLDAPPPVSRETMPQKGLAAIQNNQPSQDDRDISPQAFKARINQHETQKPDIWQALMAAGFATAAGTSPYALENIGKGGLEGLKNFQDQKKSANDFNYKQGSVNEAAERLSQEATTHKDVVSHEQAQLDEQKVRDANTAKYQQGMVDWRQNQTGSGAIQNLADSIMYDDDGSVRTNPKSGQPYTPEEALALAKQSGAGNDKTKAQMERLAQDAVDKGYFKTLPEARAYYGLGQSGAQPVTPPVAKTPATAGAPPPPLPGAVIKGYRFNGGDPSQQQNWTPVQ